MKLLIVDDQIHVVKGLAEGMDWNAIGISEVFTAGNSEAARHIIKNHEIDIMLCDIEMPGENGLGLYQWIVEESYSICCIFLTGHADFQYAQRAIQLGAFDYLMQPASYHDIGRAVERAIGEVNRKRGSQEYYHMGVVFQQQKAAIIANAMRNYLLGAQIQDDIIDLASLGEMPGLNEAGYLALLQIVSWNSMQESWDGIKLAIAVGQIAREIFGINKLQTKAAAMGDDFLAVLIWSKGSEEVYEDLLKSQLIYFGNICKQELKLEFAIYFNRIEQICDISEIWKKLHRWKDSNVMLRSGVYASEIISTRKNSYKIPNIVQWGKLLKEGYYQTVEHQAVELLEVMVKEERLTETVLYYFYQEFMQLLYQSLQGKEEMIYHLLESQQGMELYRNGMKSVEKMSELIHFSLQRLEAPSNEVPNVQAIVDKIKAYIDEHLEQDIRREDIARAVFLNPDYVTRLFKKETDMTLKEYIIQQKLKSAQSLLKTTNLPISFIAAKLGYKNFSHFSTAYKKAMGKSPQEERL